MAMQRACDGSGHFSGGLPPGCREGDGGRAASPLDDLSPPQLWRLLDERQKSLLYRQFFRDEWAELAAILDDPPPRAGESIRALWLAWRDTAVTRLAMDGQIRRPR